MKTRKAQRGRVALRPYSFAQGAAAAVLLALLTIVGCRAWLAQTMPLTDTTEARYGEIARKMVETGDWLTPQHDYGVPYLGKPPLAFWLSAAGIELFGAGELGPRLPIMLVTLAFSVFLFAWTWRELDIAAAAAATILLMSSFLFFVAMAAVMTDMVLTVCVTSALLAFWSRWRGGSWGWELALYVLLALGLLDKGPLAAFLVVVPALVWALIHGHVLDVLRRFAWLKGALLVAALAFPWFLAEEWRNPGFLNYFIIGENLNRFLVPGWQGDLYGTAHNVPIGTIWLFLLIGALPWSILCVPLLIALRRTVERNWHERRELVSFMLIGALTPLLLFTLSRNVIFPYALPALPMIMIAVVSLGAPPAATPSRLIGAAAVAALTVAAVVAGATTITPFIDRHTQKPVIAAIRLHEGATNRPIYYWQKRFFSADYYSRGAASVIADAEPIGEALSDRQRFSFVIPSDELDALPHSIASELRQFGVVSGFALLEPEYENPVAALENARL